MDPANRAGRAAPRFLLHPGELLCLDNYRVFHGREPYAGSDRILHKLWAWTDMAFGLPYPRAGLPPSAGSRHRARLERCLSLTDEDRDWGADH
jgi:hypothetical protein